MSYTTQLTATPEGLKLAGLLLIKRADNGKITVSGQEHTLLSSAQGEYVPGSTMRYITRAGELLAGVPDSAWDDRAPHQPNDIPALAKVNMLIALSGLQPVDAEAAKLRLQKARNALKAGVEPHHYLRKLNLLPRDAAEAFKYSPDQPRVPAGNPDGGQWTDEDSSGAFENSVDSQFAQALRIMLSSPASPKNTPFDDSNDRIEPSYPMENLIGFLGGGEILSALRSAGAAADAATPAVNTAVEDAANAVRDYLGDDAKMIVNKNGDLVLMNDTQKVRFNINNSHGYDPHFHIEEFDGNDWIDAGNQHMYFFKE